MFLYLLFTVFPACFVSKEIVQVLNDPLDNLDEWSVGPHGGVNMSDGLADRPPLNFCTDPGRDCVRICGVANEDNYIERNITLDDISNINISDYDSFAIVLDLHTSELDSTVGDRCEVKIKWDTDSEYTVLTRWVNREKSVSRDYDEQLQNEIINFPIDQSSNMVTIRLESEVDSTSATTTPYCYYDNFRLYVRDEKEVIWRDEMENLDDWTTAGAVSTGIFSNCSDPVTCCTDGQCVEIDSTTTAEDASIIRITENINEWKDLLIKYNVHLKFSNEEDACQLWYRYNNDEPDEFKLLRSIGGDSIINDRSYDTFSVLYTTQINCIPPPKSTDGLSSLEIKFRNMAEIDENEPDPVCYYDEIELRGTNEPTIPYPSSDNDPNDYHIIVLGDWGGDDQPPYVTTEQLTTAAMMETVAYLNDYTFEAFLALGDNFYDDGLNSSTAALRFEKTFVEVYHEGLGSIISAPWYPISGNHDWPGTSGDTEGVQIQIDYTNIIDNWEYPYFWYNKIWDFGNDITLEFIGIDTIIFCGKIFSAGKNVYNCSEDYVNATLAEIQWQWLEKTIEESTATFIIIGGHHPVYSFQNHGPSSSDGPNGSFSDRLVRLFDENKCIISYVSGHDHALEYIERENQTVQYIISGAAHGCRHEVDFTDEPANPINESDPLKYNNCNQGGFVDCTINTNDITFQCSYYLGTDPNIKFKTGIWTNPTGNGCNDIEYETVDEFLVRTTPSFEDTTCMCLDPTMEPTMDPTESEESSDSDSKVRNVQPVYSVSGSSSSESGDDALFNGRDKFIKENNGTIENENKNENEIDMNVDLSGDTWINVWTIFGIIVIVTIVVIWIDYRHNKRTPLLPL